MLQPFKRHRHTNHSEALDTMDFEQTLTPPFFIIKEATIGPRASGFDQVVAGSVANSRHLKTTTWRGMPCEDYRRRTLDSTEMKHSSHTKDKNHDEAAKLVEAGLVGSRRRGRLAQHERILRSLICPKSPEAEFDIDDVALQGIFYSVNELFFQGRLKGRVSWTWRDLPSYLIGTTALRKSPLTDSYETLIFLSRRILKDRKYNRRLLISTFIHELIHSYLFVLCGFQSRECGGHTNGFKRIAELIDEWAGPDLLFLCNMEAELSDFETKVGAMPREPAFDGWGMPWSHDAVAGDYIVLNRPQCRLRPAARLLDRGLR